MARVRRIDLGSLTAPVRRTDGTLVAEARLTRTGVFTYRNADGSARREYRPPTQVFDEKSLASFRMVPITNDHPPGMLTADNAKQYSVGCVGENIRRDGEHMVATIAVHDAATIRAMDGGKNQVSNGYDCDLDETPGVAPDGTHYDAVQTNIVGNHLAIVHNARAGRDAAVRMDAAAQCDDADPEPRQRRNDGACMDLTQALAALAAANEKIGALTARADAADATTVALKTAAAKLEGERDSARNDLAAADKARKDAIDGTDARVSARVALLTSARKVLGGRCDAAELGVAPEFDLTAMADRAIKLAVIKTVTNADCDVDAAGAKRADAYIDARYDAACERAVASAETFRAAHDVIEQHRADGAQPVGSKAAKARQDMIDANRGAAPLAPAAK